MNKIFYIVLLLLMASEGLTGELRYSAANALTFSQSGNSKDFVGSGFLIEHKGKTYAVTAKHVLLAAMDEGLSAVDINGSVSTWAYNLLKKI